MEHIKIGIPRSMYYYYYGNLLKKFLENLGFEVVISPPTNQSIMNDGMKYAIDEMCLSLKNYIGHVAYLKDKCDYIVIPRIDNFGRNNQTCTNFLAIYDIINNLFDINILDFNINYEKGETEQKGFIQLGKQLKCSYSNSITAYQIAKTEDMNELDRLIRKNIHKLSDNKLKILIVGHPYNLYDDYIGAPIIKLLKQENISLIYSNLFPSDKTNKMAKKLSKSIYFKYNKENIGSIELCKKQIDGIIFLTTFPCGPDSLVNELVFRKLKVPYLNLIIDDLDSMAGFETRIESFIDMIKERKKLCEK
jgi:predicted nucleotide-binding protein (sugar kinase/HSP70/actin superfamily)